MDDRRKTALVIVGGGPSGLAAAFEATRRGATTCVLESADRVGGLARTLASDGHRYDIGPHRFFTTNAEVRALFVDVVGEDVVTVRRRTHILYGGRRFDYPLTPLNALFGLGMANSVALLASYARARARRLLGTPPIESFEDWIVDRFGDRLYRQFFKSYTEKVWGIPCARIGADWAAQRIKGLSLGKAIRHALRRRQTVARTLTDEFLYPRLGAGQFYDKLAALIASRGARIMLGTPVTRIRHRDNHVTCVSIETGAGEREIGGDHYLCSAPLTDMLGMLDPPPPREVMDACRALRYRNHICVQLRVRGCAFADQWLYVHTPQVRAARIANFRNFSPAMAPDGDVSPLGVEYFCFPGDELWEMPDAELVGLAARELSDLGVAAAGSVLGGFVVRSEKAYPVIEMGCEEHVARIRRWLAGFTNLLPIGRSGMFKYNNQDHAIATGLLAARTALGVGNFDPWNVNVDAEYHEAGIVSDED